MNQETTLKPCPFCGSLNLAVQKENDEMPSELVDWIVECMTCQIRVGSFGSESYALTAWNRRPLSTVGIELIAKERQRQIEAEGFTAGHDDNYPANVLSYAALCYLVPDAPDTVMSWWPWDWKWWKPKDKLSNLVKAGALVAAEIDRLVRAETEERIK